MSDRIDKINSETQKVLSQAVRNLKDPRLDGKFYTITHCDVSRDFSWAKVYVSVMSGEDVIVALNDNAGILRRELGKGVVLHKTPELQFISDNSLDHSERINQVLDEVL